MAKVPGRRRNKYVQEANWTWTRWSRIFGADFDFSEAVVHDTTGSLPICSGLSDLIGGISWGNAAMGNMLLINIPVFKKPTSGDCLQYVSARTEGHFPKYISTDVRNPNLIFHHKELTLFLASLPKCSTVCFMWPLSRLITNPVPQLRPRCSGCQVSHYHPAFTLNYTQVWNQGCQIDAHPSSEEFLHHPKCLADPPRSHYFLLQQSNVTCFRFITHPCVCLCAYMYTCVFHFWTDVSICHCS